MFHHPIFGQCVDVREIGAPVAAGAAIDNNSDIIDMANFEGVMFVASITDSVNTGVATLTIEQNDANSDTGMSALAGAVAMATSGANDDLNGQLLIVDIYRPRERYVQAVRSSATANIAFGTMFAVLYGARKLPISDHATVAASAALNSPAEG